MQNSENKGKFKRYMIILELKEEYVKQYCDIHRNAWPEIMESIKSEGANELLIWNYKNLSIVYYECEDIDKLYSRINKLEVTKKWNAKVHPWIAVSPILDGTGKMEKCEKIFDLNQQLAGKLEQF